eukprot:1049156-Rhodomonas_salina.1
MPPPENCLHSGKLLKRVVTESVSWSERKVALTHKQIAVGRSAGETSHVIEHVDLIEIEEVKLLEMHNHRDGESPGGRKNSVQGHGVHESPALTHHNSLHHDHELNFAIEIITHHDSWHRGKRYTTLLLSQL